MEDPGPNDQFFDALDDFPLDDCSDALEPEPSVPQSTISSLESDISQTLPSLRRRSSARHHRKLSRADDKAASSTSEVTQIHDGKTTMIRERKHIFRRNLEDNEKEYGNIDSSRDRENSVQNVEDARVASSFWKNTEVGDSGSSNPLMLLAELVIKAVGFQIKLFISMFTFPAQLLYHFCVFSIDPLQGMKHGRDFLLGRVLRLCNVAYESVNPFIAEWLKEHRSMWKWVTRFAWSFLLSVYVASILCVFLVAAFIASGFMMRYLVEEPVRVEETLNFDYTKNTPVAFVPIKSCTGLDCIHCNEIIELGKNGGLHVIPPNHKLQVTVMLTLPESEYNRNLGVFQVRVDFFSDAYRRLVSSSRTCMLQFKSMPVRLLSTFFKMAPLVAGYLSESQTLKVHFSGLREGAEPTACIKVTIEQRAEYRPGAGIPEIYASYLILESELPLFKRILWYWKKTIFTWVSMTMFLMELMLTLICCRPIVLPRVRLRNSSTSSSATPNNLLSQS